MIDVEERVIETEDIERLDRGEEALRVGVRALRTDQFEARLRELTHAAFLRFLVAVGRLHVRQP